MYTTNLRKIGRSIMLAMPPALLDTLHWRAGITVRLTVEHGRLIVEPKSRPRYCLDELLAQCDPSAELTPTERAWLHSKPVGEELPP